jgi:hypothetical protein
LAGFVSYSQKTRNISAPAGDALHLTGHREIFTDRAKVEHDFVWPKPPEHLRLLLLRGRALWRGEAVDLAIIF